MRPIVVFLVLAHAAAAQATVARRAPLSDLVQRADLVVVATVGATESFWRDQRILTRVELGIEDVWHGRADQRIEVVTLGGTVGDIGQIVHGAPRLSPGARVVLFLRARASGELRVLELSQGVFYVERSGVRRDFHGLRLVGDAPPVPRMLVELEHRVRELADE